MADATTPINRIDGDLNETVSALSMIGGIKTLSYLEQLPKFKMERVARKIKQFSTKEEWDDLVTLSHKIVELQ